MRSRIDGRGSIIDGIVLCTGGRLGRIPPSRQSFDFRGTSCTSGNIVGDRSGRQLWCVVTRSRHWRLINEAEREMTSEMAMGDGGGMRIYYGEKGSDRERIAMVKKRERREKGRIRKERRRRRGRGIKCRLWRKRKRWDGPKGNSAGHAGESVGGRLRHSTGIYSDYSISIGIQGQ